MAAPTQSLMTALGFSHDTSYLYDRLLPLTGMPTADVAAQFDLSVEALTEQLAPLAEFEIVRLDGVLAVLAPAEAVSKMLAASAERAQQAHDRLLNVSRAMPYLAGTAARPPSDLVTDETPLDGELFISDSMRNGIESLVGRTSGDVRWLRPDRFEMAYDDVLGRVVRSGRRVRTIYPVRAMSEAPVALTARAEIGEEVRVLPEVPTRLMILGSTHAIVPEPLGLGISPRLMLRQRGLVELAILYFDTLWQRALPPAQLRRGSDAARGVLLGQLAVGAGDEQIARRLGVSLRTVRRRIADLMDDLGVESRFAAGAEAARRGWL